MLAVLVWPPAYAASALLISREPEPAGDAFRHGAVHRDAGARLPIRARQAVEVSGGIPVRFVRGQGALHAWRLGRFRNGGINSSPL